MGPTVEQRVGKMEGCNRLLWQSSDFFSPLNLQHRKIEVSTLINVLWRHIPPRVFNANGVTWSIILFMFQPEQMH